MPRPTAAAIAIVVIGAVAVFLLVGRTETDAPGGDGGPTATTDAAEGDDGLLDANGVVEYIVDGDTIDVEFDGRVERVRLIGIDTPETKRPDTPVECWGPEATAFVSELLPLGSRVRVERDTVGRDDYGRLLGYVYRADDATFVNVELVRTGHARPLTIPPNTTHERTFVDAARDAEADDLGLWAAC